MLNNDMWKIFEATGRLEAYLYCKDILNIDINKTNKEFISDREDNLQLNKSNLS